MFGKPTFLGLFSENLRTGNFRAKVEMSLKKLRKKLGILIYNFSGKFWLHVKSVFPTNTDLNCTGCRFPNFFLTSLLQNIAFEVC